MEGFWKEEIKNKTEELKKTLYQIKELNELIEKEIKNVEEEIEEIGVDLNILSIPKFKGQTVFERYIEAVENRKKGKIRDKTKIRGMVEKNEIVKIKKDINRLKEILKK